MHIMSGDGISFPLPDGVAMMAIVKGKPSDTGYPSVRLAVTRNEIRRFREARRVAYRDGQVVGVDGDLNDILGKTITILDDIGIVLFVWEGERQNIDMAEDGDYLLALRALRCLDRELAL